jgi:hypothetical protein
MMAVGPSRGCSSLHNLARASRSALAFPSWMIDVAVKDVVVSRTTIIVYSHRLRTSAANETPTTLGGSSVLCCTT